MSTVFTGSTFSSVSSTSMASVSLSLFVSLLDLYASLFPFVCLLAFVLAFTSSLCSDSGFFNGGRELAPLEKNDVMFADPAPFSGPFFFPAPVLDFFAGLTLTF
uniref:Uncharacterized protein n=1 Tax=Cacopsylla melanoneura TaxID=428564 RepID=A0A8D8XJ69_9HEMI